MIRYKKGITNRIFDFLSRPPISALSSFIQLDKFDFVEFKELYKDDKDFSEIYFAMQQPLMVQDEHFKDYHLKDGILYKLSTICVPQGGH